MDKPLVSVIIAAYNEEYYIKDAIESVLLQTYVNLEIIIINDGSIDNTEAILLKFNDKRIKYIKNNHNLKLIESLNIGLSLSNGKYIARFDADDICYPDRIEKQVSFMESNPDIGLSGAQLEVFGNTIGYMNYPLTHEDIILNLFITSSFGNNTVIFRKELFKKYSLYFPLGYIHSEDYKLWTKWVMFTKTANLNIYLVKYRNHEKSVSVKYRKLQRETRNRIRAEYFLQNFQNYIDIDFVKKLTGPINYNRLKATKKIIQLNNQLVKFNPSKFKIICLKLWYLDSLEQVESNRIILFKYFFVIYLKLNFIFRWASLFKHYIKHALLNEKN